MSSLHLNRTRLIAAALAVPLVAVTGCGTDKLADKASEKAAEKILESAGGEDVDIDIDQDSGKATFRDADGSTFSIGGGDLPEDWPEEVPLPDGFTLEGSFSGVDDGQANFTVSGTLSGDPTEHFGALVDAFENDGWTEQHRSTTDASGSSMSSATYVNDTWTVTVLLTADDGDGDESIGVVYTVMPTDAG